MPLWPSFAQVIDFAASSVRLSASDVPMSGRGPPFLMPMPTPERAMGAREAPSILPCFARSSIPALVRIATSKASPASIWRLSAAARPKAITSLLPVSRSNAGASSSSADFTPFDASTLISAAPAEDTERTAATPSVAMDSVLTFMFADSLSFRHGRRLAWIGNLNHQVLDRRALAAVARHRVQGVGRFSHDFLLAGNDSRSRGCRDPRLDGRTAGPHPLRNRGDRT